MLRQLKTLFEQRANGGHQELAAHEMQLAVAALLLEAARSDFAIELVEEHHIGELLSGYFELAPQDTRRLMKLAHAEVDQATSLDHFTRLLDRNLNPSEKGQLMQMLWEVAFVDGRIDKYEEYLLRRISDLLHLSHSVFIQCKLKAERRIKDHQ